MGAVEERLGGFHDVMQRMDERLQEPTPDPLDQLLPADADQDLSPDQVREALAHVLQQSQRGSQEAIQQALAPILAQQREDRVEMAAERLEQRRPELKEPANAEAAVRATVDFVNRLRLPDEYKAELMSDVELIEKIWVASQAGTQPAGEVPPGGGDEAQDGHQLLDGSAAAQGGEDDDPAERIVRAGRGGGWMW